MYTVTVCSCVLSPHDTFTRSSFKCHNCIILEIWSNTAITMCYFIQLGAMWRELYKQGFKCNLSQKSPCSYDCCHTFIEVLSLGAGNSDRRPPVQYDIISFHFMLPESAVLWWLTSGRALNAVELCSRYGVVCNCSVCVWMPQCDTGVTITVFCNQQQRNVN